MSLLYIVGTGPGSISQLTEAAIQAIRNADVVIGYDLYIDLIRSQLSGKQIVSTGMMQEVQRCREAVSRARAGEAVALVSGGDAGIYGMAGLVLELIEEDCALDPSLARPEVNIIPGISALQAAAARLGAPLMHDFAVVSLSDLMTPWHQITARLEAAAAADFVIAIYNPRSKTRVSHIEEARRIILRHRSPQTPVGVVRNACRECESSIVSNLGEFLQHQIDMTSIVLIGNSSSFVDTAGHIVTPRGYAAKYGHGVKKSSPPETVEGVIGSSGALMFCGTASDVGKSVLTSAFCRILVRRGIKVAPFKSQNMSLNSFVTSAGGEIGRAQAVQAEACRIAPHTDMNPVLLKPNSDTGSQIVVQGRPIANMSVRQYDDYKPEALLKIRESFCRLRESYDFIVIEGAGSIAEINLKSSDIANLKIAEMAGCPVILVADIDRGGVFAQIVGTIELLEPAERSMIRGIIINKFRGDPDILAPGIDFIERRTGVPVLGVIPWFNDIQLPDEDSVALCCRSRVGGGGEKIQIGVVRLPRISNFTDFDPLENEADVDLFYIEKPEQLKNLDVLVIPGSKSTIADLLFLRQNGFFEAIRSFSGRIVGICGGFQMLGLELLDPFAVESEVKEAEGLGLLPARTVLLPEKATHQVLAELSEAASAAAPDSDRLISGYEIHMGVTTLDDDAEPFSRIYRRGETDVSIKEGGVTEDARIVGTYLHGLFANGHFSSAYLNRIRSEKGIPRRGESTSTAQIDPFEQMADRFEKHIDMKRILAISGLESDSR